MKKQTTKPNHWKTAAIILMIIILLLLFGVSNQQRQESLYKFQTLTLSKGDLESLANQIRLVGGEKFQLCDIENNKCAYIMLGDK